MTKVPEFFFDRNPANFSAILDIYRTNMFHLTSTGCALVLQKDMEYWGIDELMMEPCCALKYYPEIETCVNEKQGDLKEKQREKELAEEENFGDSAFGQFRSWLWNVMEYPWTSKLAQFNAFFSLGMVVVSTLTFIISTLEDFKEEMSQEEPDEWTLIFNMILEYIDCVVIIFFTVECRKVGLCTKKNKIHQKCHELGRFIGIDTFLFGTCPKPFGRCTNHWKNRQNRTSDSSHEDFEDFQVGSPFCWFAKSLIYFEASLQGTWAFDVTSGRGYFDFFEFGLLC